MGYLLKEALKTLCGVNQWSYAIFWKIGCQNPKLLIWEECYYEPIIYSSVTNGIQTGNKVHTLVTKMMKDNYVNLLGEGLVGRVLFTGNHQWIISDNTSLTSHPPEVSNEVCVQFSAGMQTIAVIPIHPHGVVQLGSSLTIRENVGFVNDVKSLIFQLGCVPGALLSENYTRIEGGSDQAVRVTNPNGPFRGKQQMGFDGAEGVPDGWSRLGLDSYNQDRQTAFSGPIREPDSAPWKQDSEHESFRVFTDETRVKPPSGDDLFDVVGIDFKNTLFDRGRNGLVDNGSELKPLNPVTSRTILDPFSICERESGSGVCSLTSNDHLLDAVVSKVQSPVASSFSGGPHKNAFSEIGVSKKTAGAGCYSFTDFSETGSIVSSGIGSWVDGKHEARKNCGVSSEDSKKGDGIGKSNRKRLKPGENPRPRPKDRQMIQDRVKELREIVPNGAKCSIDALLERTIKHMLFLQSVTKHADKLKQSGESKIVSNEGGGLLLRDNFEGGGATWAYEVGSQSMVCPIIVEDLSSPRQMLVEMLCEESGLFLEIADIIKGLGLTILKGVMESRNDKVWAHFTVEANRDVTRMEIFVSLVSLLEQAVKKNESQNQNHGPPSFQQVGSTAQ